MALPKKRLRKLTLNGIQYGWLIRRKPTWSQGHQCPMTLAIQELACDTPAVLHVTLNITRPDNFFNEHQTSITPAAIKDMIELAIQEGWIHNAGGAAYEFQYEIKKESEL